MNNKICLRFLFLFVALFVNSVFGTIRLPRLVSDGMVLQRDAKVSVWGWGKPSENIKLAIDNRIYQTSVAADGKWQVMIAPHKAGGPFSMIIEGENRIEIQNILFGEVWLCSGQSNMELPMYRVKPLYEKEIASANNPNIRCFTVPQKYNFKEIQSDYLSGNWQSVTPQTILNFSAVAYFFANEINTKYNVPVGLINASLGGSPVQAWLSEEALKAFPDYLSEAYRFRNDSLIRQIEADDSKRSDCWYSEANQKDLGLKEGWRLARFDDKNWMEMNLPGYWAETEIGPVNGVVWLRKEFTLTKSECGKGAFLNMGRIVDADSVFINDKYIGNTTYQYPPRWYNVPENLLVEGRNIVVIRVVSNAGKGGFVLDKPYELKVNGSTIDLKGIWKMKLGCIMPTLAGQTFIRWKPMGLYNAMIAPLNAFTKKGILWYQGESNVGNPMEYGRLLPALIADWRAKFNQPEIPFIFVQLPNFMEAKPQPSESNWALFREIQANTLSLPKTSMAVAIDAGEWNDIHPLNKKIIGQRLAKLARQNVYHEKRVEAVSPRYKSMKVIGEKIEISFIGAKKRLVTTDGGSVKTVAIAGVDRKFVWAKCEIMDGKLLVWNDAVKNPIAVRYAWADNPEGANLMDEFENRVVPFRTDKW